MEKKSNEVMLAEIYMLLVGIPGSSSEGLCGTVEKIERHLASLNGQVAKNTTARKVAIVVGSGLWLIVSGLIIALVKTVY